MEENRTEQNKMVQRHFIIITRNFGYFTLQAEWNFKCKLHQHSDQSQTVNGLRQSRWDPISEHHDSRKRSPAHPSCPTVEDCRGSGNQGNLKVSTDFNKDTPLFLISYSASRTYQHGGGSSRDRGSPQSAPDYRETDRLLQRLTGRLQPAHLCRFTVISQPGVVGFRLQLLRGATHTKTTEAHTLESGRESSSQETQE